DVLGPCPHRPGPEPATRHASEEHTGRGWRDRSETARAKKSDLREPVRRLPNTNRQSSPHFRETTSRLSAFLSNRTCRGYRRDRPWSGFHLRRPVPAAQRRRCLTLLSGPCRHQFLALEKGL